MGSREQPQDGAQAAAGEAIGQAAKGEAAPGSGLPDKPWKPTREQLQYLIALKEALEDGGRVSDRAIAAKTGIDRKKIWRWRKNPQWWAWIDAEVTTLTRGAWPLIVERQVQLALRGSTRAAVFVARVLGKMGPEPGSAFAFRSRSADGSAFEVTIGVPQPDWSEDAPEQAVPQELREALDTVPQLVTSLSKGVS